MTPETPYRLGLDVHYYREVADEPPIPFDEVVLHADDDLLVADKPHFLPVTPAGVHVHETLLGASDPPYREPRVGAPAPHRSRHRRTRAVLDPPAQSRPLPGAVSRTTDRQELRGDRTGVAGHGVSLRSFKRMVAGEPFFRMQEIEVPANSETRIDVVARGDGPWRYALTPITGRKHQLRVHMAALGAPIANDALYPSLVNRASGDYSAPLQLLARQLSFLDPLSGVARSFSNQLPLQG